MKTKKHRLNRNQTNKLGSQSPVRMKQMFLAHISKTKTRVLLCSSVNLGRVYIGCLYGCWRSGWFIYTTNSFHIWVSKKIWRGMRFCLVTSRMKDKIFYLMQSNSVILSRGIPCLTVQSRNSYKLQTCEKEWRCSSLKKKMTLACMEYMLCYACNDMKIKKRMKN